MENFGLNLSDEQKQSIAYLAERIKVMSENAKWEIDLSLSDTLMLRAFLREQMIKLSKLSEEEFNRRSKIANEYLYIKDFYSNVEIYKKERKMGVTSWESKRYDMDISEAEAFQKYCGVNEETAKQYNEEMSIYKDDIIDIEALIRQHYTGSLAMQLGKDDEEFQKNAKEYETFIEEKVAPLAKKIIDKMKPSLEKMGDLINKMREEYDSRQKGDSGPKMGM